jgi:pyruvate/2-oxoglutarate dehydrogenase complex dihydrolipoamide dehydrogenase (E3) component
VADRADRYDLVVVGMGSGGMAAAQFAAGLRLRVAVVERGRIGGDRVWTGDVPSKALLASARAAHMMRHADRFGIGPVEPVIDLATVWRRVRAIQHELATAAGDERHLTEMGVDVIRGEARVTGPNEVTVDDDRVLPTGTVLLCAGSRPALPDLPGLASARSYTSDNLFEIDEPPQSMVIVGGGPMGVEMAQALTRLGVAVTVVQRGPTLLRRDEPVLVGLLQTRLGDEGVAVHTGATATAVTTDGSAAVVHAAIDTTTRAFGADAVLMATGRRPNVDGLGLEDAGVTVGERGVEVDDRGRTSVRSIYAVGDIAGRSGFTHAAAHEALRAVRDAFFPGKGTVTDLVPWCTFTDPELAHVGPTVAEAEARYGDDVDVWRLDLANCDRARTDSAALGGVMIVTVKRRVAGAHVLAPHAGEMIHELALAIRQGLKLREVAALVHVYPTFSSAIAQVAGEAAFEKAQRLRWLLRTHR